MAMSPQEMRDASWCTPPSQVPHAWPLPWLPLGPDGTCRHGRFPPRLTPSAAALTPARHAAQRRRQRRPRARSAATTSSTARSCSRSRRPPSSAVRATSSLAAATASPSVSMRSRPRSRSPRSTGALDAPGNAHLVPCLGSPVSSQTSEGERELRPKRGAFPHGKTRASRDHTGGGHGRDLGCSGGGHRRLQIWRQARHRRLSPAGRHWQRGCPRRCPSRRGAGHATTYAISHARLRFLLSHYLPH